MLCKLHGCWRINRFKSSYLQFFVKPFTIIVYSSALTDLIHFVRVERTFFLVNIRTERKMESFWPKKLSHWWNLTLNIESIWLDYSPITRNPGSNFSSASDSIFKVKMIQFLSFSASINRDTFFLLFVYKISSFRYRWRMLFTCLFHLFYSQWCTCGQIPLKAFIYLFRYRFTNWNSVCRQGNKKQHWEVDTMSRKHQTIYRVD